MADGSRGPEKHHCLVYNRRGDDGGIEEIVVPINDPYEGWDYLVSATILWERELKPKEKAAGRLQGMRVKPHVEERFI